MNKKIMALIVCALMVIPFSLVSCTGGGDTQSAVSDTLSEAVSGTSSEPADEVSVPAAIKAAGKIKMATNANFPPYEYMDDNGDYAGIDVEMMQAVADLWGVELSIENMEFGAILAAIETGKADVGVAGMTITEERLVNVDFSHTYAKAKQVIIVPADSDITSVEDLAGKKVGVQLGTTGDIYVEEDETLTAERYSNGVDAVVALTQNKVDAVIIDSEPAKVFAAQYDSVKIIEAPYADEDYAIAIKKGNTELTDAINAALITLDENGTLDEIINKFIKAD